MSEEVITYPDPRLLKASKSAKPEEVEDIVVKLTEAAQALSWGRVVGLAAPQIGINKRVFIALGMIFINPEIVWTPKDGNRVYREGCYSLEKDRYDYRVKRPYAVTLKWTDIKGEEHEERFNGERAQVILHEYDHLEGLLCNKDEEKK